MVLVPILVQQFSIVLVVVHQVRTILLDSGIRVVFKHLLYLYIDRVYLEMVIALCQEHSYFVQAYFIHGH